MNQKLFFFILLFLCSIGHWAQNKKFKVVLDAGHGGKDYGATYHGNIEKNIALKTALKVGDILKEEHDIEVVFTRSTDVFVELDERATIANKSKGHLFISMHCNANPNQAAAGNETYVMGITKSASNLEVAKKENAVVTLESNYKIKYDGFDPKKPESVIGISILQEENLQQSIEIAGKVQQAFTKFTSNKNRGVKQAGFLVLRKIAMPRILIEMGFVSNKAEGAFLNAEQGQQKLAEAIATAIINYKKDYFHADTYLPKKNENAETEIKKDKTNNTEVNKEKENSDIEFKVQISASGKKMETIPSNFKGLKGVTIQKDRTIYKYFYGLTTDYKKAKLALEEAKKKGFTSSFIVAIQAGKEISLKEALK
ncbi:MAG: N-acetylmuramoyl-L-alanine amidase family protein [Flavobacterium sp.]